MITSFNKEELAILREWMPKLGIDSETFELHLKRTYEQYIQMAQEESDRAIIDGEWDESYEKDLEMTKSEFEEFTRDIEEQARVLLNTIKSLSNNVEQPKNGPREFTHLDMPYVEIFNGNFPRLDKEKMTFADRVQYGVDTIPYECWDIYADVEKGLYLPVFYDWSTVNESFAAFAVFLKKYKKRKKVNLNHNIPLVLLNKDLMGVNLHSSLTQELEIAAAKECEINPIYMLREAIRFMDKNTKEMVPFELTIGSWTVLWLYAQRFNVYSAAPRQVGKTTILTTLIGGDWACGLRNATVLTVHFKADDAGKNRKAMVDAANTLPRFLKFHNLDRTEKKGVTTWIEKGDMQASLKSNVIVNKMRENKLYIASVGTTETTAERVGRGLTVDVAFPDEINFYKHSRAMNTSLQFAHGTAKLMAEKANQRAGLYYTSTAGTLDTKHGLEMYDWIYNQMCQWKFALFGYDYKSLKHYMEVNSKKHFFNVEYNYKELGFDEKWLDMKIANNSSGREGFMTEMLGVWHNVSSKSIYSAKAMARLDNMSRNKLVSNFIYDKFYSFNYFPSNDQVSFVEHVSKFKMLSVGIDIAYGQDNDSSTMVAVDMETGVPVFYYKSNTNVLFQFGKLILDFFHWLRKACPSTGVILVIENDGPGQGIIPELKRDKYIESRMFKVLKYYDKDKNKRALKATNRVLSDTQYVEYGITQREYRTYLYDTLSFHLVDSYPMAFSYPDVFSELTTLYRKPSGRIDHKNGAHDDVVMGTLLAYSIIFNPVLRAEMTKFFDFMIDFTKITATPLQSTVIVDFNREDDKTTASENELVYKIVSKSDGIYTWDEIEGYVVRSGRKVELDDIQIMQEIKKRGIVDPLVITMRPRPIQSLARELTTYGTGTEFNVSNVGVKNNEPNTKMPIGRAMSHTSNKGSMYMKNNLLNNKAKMY